MKLKLYDPQHFAVSTNNIFKYLYIYTENTQNGQDSSIITYFYFSDALYPDGSIDYS